MASPVRHTASQDEVSTKNTALLIFLPFTVTSNHLDRKSILLERRYDEHHRIVKIPIKMVHDTITKLDPRTLLDTIPFISKKILFRNEIHSRSI